MHSLGLEFVESVILALPEAHRHQAVLQSCWRQLEKLVRANRVLTIGCSDISSQQLEDLCSWAEVSDF
jgi:diketogulonate reductase-like aldo/keto reductase